MYYFEVLVAVVNKFMVFWFLYCVLVKLADVSEKCFTVRCRTPTIKNHQIICC